MSVAQTEHGRLDPMFTALCVELGFCLHDKGCKRVIAALPAGLDAAVKAVLAADGVDFLTASGTLKRQVRDCLKAHLPDAAGGLGQSGG